MTRRGNTKCKHMDDRHRKKVESLIKLSFGTFLAISIPGSVHAPPPDTPPYTQPIIEQDFQSSLLVLRSQCGLSTIFVQAGQSRKNCRLNRKQPDKKQRSHIFVIHKCQPEFDSLNGHCVTIHVDACYCTVAVES